MCLSSSGWSKFYSIVIFVSFLVHIYSFDNKCTMVVWQQALFPKSINWHSIAINETNLRTWVFYQSSIEIRVNFPSAKFLVINDWLASCKSEHFVINSKNTNTIWHLRLRNMAYNEQDAAYGKKWLRSNEHLEARLVNVILLTIWCVLTPQLTRNNFWWIRYI